MVLQKLIFFLLFSVCSFGYAKSGDIYGVVKSEKGPLSFANVFIEMEPVRSRFRGYGIEKSVPKKKLLVRLLLMYVGNHSNFRVAHHSSLSLVEATASISRDRLYAIGHIRLRRAMFGVGVTDGETGSETGRGRGRETG